MKHLKILICLIVLVKSTNIFAGTYTVTNTLDSGPGSLRDAINYAAYNFGADNIIFHLPTSDPNYNAVTGIWTITPSTVLPNITGAGTFINGLSQSTYGNTNTYGPEIFINGNNLLNTGFVLLSSTSRISGLGITGFIYGIQIAVYTEIIISDNYIGTNFDGTLSNPNNYGIAIATNSSENQIINNLISGNSIAGIAINGSANGNIIQGNKIGTDRTGTLKIPNNYGIAIEDGPDNIIGGINIQDMNLISGNLTAGIVINETAQYAISSGNLIKGNFIGTNISGTDSLPNGCGIILAGARNTVIGGDSAGSGNIISGNYQAGIVMNGSGTRNNEVKGNYIGTNKDGNDFISNHTGVMLKSNSNHNIIGGTTPAERNIISGNIEIGVYLEACDSNAVMGNYIGPDVTGNGFFAIGDSLIQGNGLELNTISKYNIVGGNNISERNIISGNRVYGLVYYGNSSYNNTSYNYIGVNASGNQRLGNATGICVDGGSNHNRINNNILSGNKSYGIFFVTTGTYYNEFKGNKVGVNATNTDTIPNYIGIILGAGTRYNVLGGTAAGEANIISGNYYDGIEIADMGTDHNQIIGNIIGASAPGGFGNFNGIGVATNPRNNTISYNTISGNKYMGIILFEHADSNIISNNKIGVSGNNNDSCGNGAAGIAIIQGSSNNMIGPGNIIAYNDTAGIILNDNNTLNNTITQNALFNNGLSQIDIFPPGPNPNDPGDPDSGPNLKMNHPDIFSTGYNPANGSTFIAGMIDYNYQNPIGIKIEVFCSYTDSAGIGKCMNYLGSTLDDSTGNWTFFANNIAPGDSIVTTATDIYGNTSEISPSFSVIVGVNEISGDEDQTEVFPNPANENFTIKIATKNANNVDGTIYDINGKLIKKIFSGKTIAGINQFFIKTDGLHDGLYFVKVVTQNISYTRKLYIIR